MVERLFLPVPWDCLQFVIVAFPDHTHLLFFNVSHIVPKIDEIRILMSNENSPHILGLCETFLRTNNHESQLSICGYNFFRKDRTDTKEKNDGVYWALLTFNVDWTWKFRISKLYGQKFPC